MHLVYLKHLKESVETLREIVEEAKVERPLDSSLHQLAVTTKHSQEWSYRSSFGIWTQLFQNNDWERSAAARNFVKKFIGTVRFGNDHFGAIMGYGDYVIGESEISRVYYVEGLGHNLFFVGQFCDSDLEVAFKKRHDEVLSDLIVVQSLQEQIMVVASAFKPLELCHARNFWGGETRILIASILRELVPQPDYVMIIALKWIYKVKLDEYSDVLKNKARYKASPTKKQASLTQKANLEALKRVFISIGTITLGSLGILKYTTMAQTAYEQMRNHASPLVTKKKRAQRSQQQRQNTLPCMDVCASAYLDAIIAHNYGFAFNKIPLYCDNAVPLLSAAIISNIPGPSTLTYDTIS
ncbi:hypothetical protein Tco_1476563 [Tanacetum coccineum]